MLSFDADEVFVASSHPRPNAFACVLRLTGCDDVIGAIATESELRERAAKVGATLDGGVQARQVARPRTARVMTQHAERRADVADSSGLPARNFRDAKPGARKYFGQPGQRVDHD